MARMKKKSFRDRITLGDIINVIVLLAFTFLCFYPFWYIFIGSVSNPNISVRPYPWPARCSEPCCQCC